VNFRKEQGMANETAPRDLRQLWQEQEVETVIISMDEIRRRARSFERRIQRRNLREYVAGVVAVAAMALQFGAATQMAVRIAFVLLAGGTAYVMWRLLTQGAVRELPEEMGRANCVAFYRRELERQRDLLRGIWKWYLAPFVPGLAVLTAASFVSGKPNLRWVPVAFAGFVVLAFWGIASFNRRAADRLEQQIREIAGWEQASDPE
jgi:hypothetical protein